MHIIHLSYCSNHACNKIKPQMCSDWLVQDLRFSKDRKNDLNKLRCTSSGQCVLDEEFFRGHMGQKGSQGLSRGIFRGGSPLIWAPRGLETQFFTLPGQALISGHHGNRRSHRGRRVTSRCCCAARWQSDETKTTDNSILFTFWSDKWLSRINS